MTPNILLIDNYRKAVRLACDLDAKAVGNWKPPAVESL